MFLFKKTLFPFLALCLNISNRTGTVKLKVATEVEMTRQKDVTGALLPPSLSGPRFRLSLTGPPLLPFRVFSFNLEIPYFLR